MVPPQLRAGCRHIAGACYRLTQRNPKVHPMQTIIGGYRGLSLLVDLNWDRLLYLATIGGALFLYCYFGAP